jgi:GntR family transcriptional regulator, histidine utilization repressor
MNIATQLDAKNPEPLYLQIKRLIVGKIQSGEWKSGDKIPTEHALVRDLKASRMTINRALRELTQDGILARRQGSGTFVAPAKLETGLLEIKNIADEIAFRGNSHNSEILALEAAKAPDDISRVMSGSSGNIFFHCVLLHRENDVPVQLEVRYVNPELVPDFLDQDFGSETPSGFLIRTVPYSRADHRISAEIPSKEHKRLLDLKDGEPVLTLERHTYAADKVITTVRLYHPGSRFAFGGAFTPDRG